MFQLYQNNNTVSDLMILFLSALFKCHTSSKLPGWVICPHGFPFSLCYHSWMWRLHPHEPEDIQFPQYKLQRWVLPDSQLINVSTWRFCATSNSPASQAPPEERWGSKHPLLVHVKFWGLCGKLSVYFFSTNQLCGFMVFLSMWLLFNFKQV